MGQQQFEGQGGFNQQRNYEEEEFREAIALYEELNKLGSGPISHEGQPYFEGKKKRFNDLCKNERIKTRVFSFIKNEKKQ